jgi:predicted nucleic acid-binding protein
MRCRPIAKKRRLRSVWAPHKASPGTSIEPKLSVSVRVEDIGITSLLFDSAAAAAYVAVVAAGRGSGRPISQFDTQIATIALSRHVSPATRNASDFADCGLKLTNPWSAR